LKVDPDGRQAVIPAPGTPQTAPLTAALLHAQKMNSDPSYRRAAVDATMHAYRAVQTFGLGLLAVLTSGVRAFLVTPNGTVLPGGKDVNLVPTATGAANGVGWLQIHDTHPHNDAQPHTHRPETHIGPNGEVDVKRTDKPTSAEDIDEADQKVKDGELRPRTDRKDKGDRQRAIEDENGREQ
jgi:hypothetical protein